MPEVGASHLMTRYNNERDPAVSNSFCIGSARSLIKLVLPDLSSHRLMSLLMPCWIVIFSTFCIGMCRYHAYISSGELQAAAMFFLRSI